MNDRHEKLDPAELERIAAHLDGGAPLDNQESRDLARQLRRDLAWLDGQLDVHVNDEMLLGISARLQEALGRRRRRRRTLVIPASLAAAVALAAVLMAVLVWRPQPAAPLSGVLAQNLNQAAQDELGRLDEDMLHLVARLAMARPDELELQFPSGENGEEEDPLSLPESTPPIY